MLSCKLIVSLIFSANIYSIKRCCQDVVDGFVKGLEV